MSGGNLTQTDVTVIKNDLKLVLEHVQDLQDEMGSNPQTEQFKRAVNAHMRAFEIGSVTDVSKLILQAITYKNKNFSNEKFLFLCRTPNFPKLYITSNSPRNNIRYCNDVK